MKKIVLAVAFSFLLASCAGKSGTTDAKKSDKPVISVLDGASSTPAKTEVKTPAGATEVLESPKFTPTPKANQEAAKPAEPDSPKEIIKSYTAELQSVSDDPKNTGKKRERQISEKVRKFFDFPGLARLSLGSNWDTLSEKKRNEFTDLFTRLIEKSYLRRSKSLVGNYQLSYGNEQINGDKATVACEIYKDDVDLEIIYELHKTANSWMIYNVVFDQVNLAKNYQTQFNQIIAKSGFKGLTDMMNKKLKESPSDVENSAL